MKGKILTDSIVAGENLIYYRFDKSEKFQKGDEVEFEADKNKKITKIEKISSQKLENIKIQTQNIAQKVTQISINLKKIKFFAFLALISFIFLNIVTFNFLISIIFFTIFHSICIFEISKYCEIFTLKALNAFFILSIFSFLICKIALLFSSNLKFSDLQITNLLFATNFLFIISIFLYCAINYQIAKFFSLFLFLILSFLVFVFGICYFVSYFNNYVLIFFVLIYFISWFKFSVKGKI